MYWFNASAVRPKDNLRPRLNNKDVFFFSVPFLQPMAGSALDSLAGSLLPDAIKTTSKGEKPKVRNGHSNITMSSPTILASV